MTNRIVLCVLVLGLLPVCAGCGGRSGPPLYKVTGVLTVKGTPATEVNVILVPVPNKNKYGQVARGLTNEKGEFVLSSSGGVGVAPGTYRVTLSSTKKMGSRDEAIKFNEKLLSFGGKNEQTVASRRQRVTDPAKNEEAKAELEKVLGFPVEYAFDSTSPREFEMKEAPTPLEIKL